LICQLEIPATLARAALRIAREEGVLTLFNPAPAVPDLPEEFYGLSDILCPNETETEILTGKPVTTIQEAESAARDLVERGAGKVILTLGERGSLLVTRDDLVYVPAEPTRAVDTTGAGDCYLGSLAYFLARGVSLKEAMKRAGRVASISGSEHGHPIQLPNG
jgi:ribokinase